MTDDLLHTAQALADILAAENAALEALDIGLATHLLVEKRQAADGFAAAHARLAAAGPLPAAARARLEATATTLRAAAEENRRLLERAIAVQTRVMDVIARAAPHVGAEAPRYGAQGGIVGRNHALPMAIAASI
jgi:hypothetical protein